MAAAVSMPAPVCLIESTAEGEFVVKQDAVEILDKITQPVVVVAIVGLYRTGKSYLMNKLAGKNKGFSLGSTIQSHTKGIWMWCFPHPKKPNNTLVLLDTEGLGDVEKGDSNNDNWIFSLAVLLSSAFVYNSLGTIDQRALEQLHYVTELSKHIKVKSPGCNDHKNKVSDTADFMSFFPTFIWTVRDFSLELKLNNEPITADEYLENSLQLIKGDTPKVSKLNLPRECIRFYFPGRKCFVFERPTSTDNLKRLEELSENDLEPTFNKQIKEFRLFIFRECRTKTIEGGYPITGKFLGNLARTYVEAIRRGSVPCIENTVLTLAQIENSAAVQEALAHYVEKMRERVKFPTATVKVLLDLHAECEKEAITIFMERSFKDEDQEFQKKLEKLVKDKAEYFCAENEQRSKDICRDLLQQLSTAMERKISDGDYRRPGGYLCFVEDQKEIRDKYKQTPGKGVKAEEVLQEFLQMKESVAMSILKMEQTLTQKDKEIGEERAKAQAVAREMKLKEEMQAAAQQKLEAQQKSHLEYVIHLTEKKEEDRLKMMEDNERVMSQKLKEQALLIKEGAERQQRQMQEEIQSLRQRMAEASKQTAEASKQTAETSKQMAEAFIQMAEASKLKRRCVIQ